MISHLKSSLLVFLAFLVAVFATVHFAAIVDPVTAVATGAAVFLFSCSLLSSVRAVFAQGVLGVGTALATVTSDPMIKEYAQGAAQDAMKLLFVADYLAPRVNVSTLVGRFKKYDQKNRFRIPNTRRGLNGLASQIGFTATDSTYNANINALDFPIDNIEKMEEGDLGNIVREAADMVAEVAALSWANEVVTAAVNAVEAVSPALTSGVDPVKVIDGYILALLKTTLTGGALGVRVLFGATAWLNFKNHPLVTAKFIRTLKSSEQPQVTTEMASSLFLTNPDVQVSYGVYDTAAEGLAAAPAFVLDDTIVIFMTKPNPTRLDPSFMKTFAPRGQFMVPGSYVKPDGRGECLKFDWNCVAEVTNTAAATIATPTWS
jgi:hypothetical protein